MRWAAGDSLTHTFCSPGREQEVRKTVNDRSHLKESRAFSCVVKRLSKCGSAIV